MVVDTRWYTNIRECRSKSLSVDIRAGSGASGKLTGHETVSHKSIRLQVGKSEDCYSMRLKDL